WRPFSRRPVLEPGGMRQPLRVRIATLEKRGDNDVTIGITCQEYLIVTRSTAARRRTHRSLDHQAARTDGAAPLVASGFGVAQPEPPRLIHSPLEGCHCGLNRSDLHHAVPAGTDCLGCSRHGTPITTDKGQEESI